MPTKDTKTQESAQSDEVQTQEATQSDEVQSKTQESAQSDELQKSFDERVNEALNSQSASEQIKTTLLVAFELVQNFDELNEHYRKDLEQFNNNLERSNALYQQFADEKAKFESNYTQILETLNTTNKEFKDEVARVETLKNTIEAIKGNIDTMSATISQQKDDIEKLVNELDLVGIDERIKALNTKKAEFDEYLPTLENKKDEFNAFMEQQKVELEQYLAQFRASLDEIDFVQNTEPTSGLNGQSWLDTSKGVINIFSQNERIRFAQKDEPTNFARLGDSWVKTAQNAIFMKEKSGNEWVNLQTNALDFEKIDFKQIDEPEFTEQDEGKCWLKMSALNVFYLENKSFVQIDKKLVRFTSESEPNASIETIQLNDIWKKSDDEIYICTAYTAEVKNEAKTPAEVVIPAKAEWTLLELAYKTAKFKRASLPDESEIANDDESENANKVQMRDLVFIVDENELYYLVKNSHNGSDETGFSWVKRADFEANARFKGESEPQELYENNLWFATKSDELQSKDGTKGELKVLKPKEQKAEWVTIAYAKKYAAFKSELMPDLKYFKNYDAWYRPMSDELYIFFDGRMHYVNKCNAFLPFLTEIKITGESTAEQETKEVTAWQMRKTLGWQYTETPIGNQRKAEIVKLATSEGLITGETLEPNLELFAPNSAYSVVFPVVFEKQVWQEADDKLYFEKLNKLNDDEVFICYNVTQSWQWQKAVHPKDINAFVWQNDLEKRVSVIERLFLPDGILREKVKENEIITPNYPQQVVNVDYLSKSLKSFDEKINRHDNEFKNTYTDAVIIEDTPSPKITLDFSYGKNFCIDLTEMTKTNYELTANDKITLNELQGQSGIIVVKGASKLKATLGSAFNVRVALSSLTALEIFSYVIFEGQIRLARS